jgi:hypothetical protein
MGGVNATLTHESLHISIVESLPFFMINFIVESASFSSLEICTLGHMNVSRFLCGNLKVFITLDA